MFEKEAKEYATRPILYGTHTWKDEEKAFKDGAEFGYNKAKEEMQKQIEKMKCCHNCRKFHNLSYDCTCAEVCNEWEIKEND